MSNGDRPARELSDYFEILRRRLRLVAAVAAVTIAMAAAYSINQATVYRSSMKIVVGQGQGIFSAEFGNAAEEFTQTMSDLLESQVVAETVIERLDIDMTPAKLLGSLNVTTKPATSVLEVSFDDTSRVRGRDILAGVGEVFTDLVGERLPQPTDGANGAIPVSATVFDPAHFVPGQVRPTPARTLAIASVLGLLLGLLAALVREQFDDTIRSLEGAERAFGLPVAATLPPHFLGYSPIARKPARGRRRTKLDPVLAELMVQKMRSEVMWPLDPGTHRTVVVTSAHEEEGKTTVAANLAVAIAKQGHDVIVVDADLRRPLLHSYLGVPVGPSTVDLEAVMRGGATVQRALMEISLLTPSEGGEERGLRPVRQVAKKSSSGSKRPPGRLRALLAAPGKQGTIEFQLDLASELMEKLHQQANIVIVDTPPILTVTDAYALVAVADTVVATTRNGRSAASATSALYRTLTRLRSKRADSLKLIVTEIEPQFDVAYGYFTPEPARAASSQAQSGLVRVENLPPSPPAGS